MKFGPAQVDIAKGKDTQYFVLANRRTMKKGSVTNHASVFYKYIQVCVTKCDG